MSAVIPFARPAARSESWSQQELAEFYRVEAALVRAGIGIASAHGVSDEGEPWFVFCRPDGDAIMHFARTDGSYLIASEVLDHPVRGSDFRALIDQIARLHPNLLPIPAVAVGTKLVVHPAALLAALVAAAALSLSSEDAHAEAFAPGLDHGPLHVPSGGGGPAHDPPHARTKGAAGPSEQDHGRRQVEAVILSTMVFAAEAFASEHSEAREDLAHLRLDPSSGTAHQTAPGDPVPGTGGGFEAGSGGGTQPGVLTTPGSGAGPDGTPTGGRSDPVPAAHADLSGDRAGPVVREVAHQAPGWGTGVGPARPGAEAGAVGTGGQQVSATGLPEGASAAPARAETDGSDPRSLSASSSTPDAGVQPRVGESAQADTGSATASPAWVQASGYADTGRAAAATASRGDDDPARDHGRGPQVEAVAAAGPGFERAAENAHGRDPHQDPPASPATQALTGSSPQTGGGDPAPGHDGDHGPPAGKAVSLPGDDAPGGGHSQAGAETGPAARGDQQGLGDHQGPTGPDAHAAESGPGRGDSGGDADPRSGSASGAPSHAPGHPESAVTDQEAGRGHGSSQGPGSGALSDGGGAAQAASRSPGSPDEGPGDATAQDTAAAHGPAARHGGAQEAESAGGPGAHGQGPTDQGSSAHEGGAPAGGQDQSGPHAPASVAQAGPASHEPPPADQTQPGHGPPSPAGFDDTHAPGASGDTPASQVGPASPAGSGHAQAVDADPVSPRADHGSKDMTPHDAPGAEGPPSSPDGTAPSAAPLASPRQAASAGPGESHPSGPADGSTAPPGPPRALIDPNGNLVFHGDPHQDAPPPAASAGPDVPAEHPTIGLVGLADHGPVVHGLYHHG